MHIAFICCEYPPAPHGGTGSSYRDLAEGLVNAGHAATVVGVYPTRQLPNGRVADETINGVRVVRLPAVPGWLRYRLGALWDRFTLRRWLVREHDKTPFDFVEASDYAGWLRFGGPRGVPTVVRIRGSNLFFDTELHRTGDAFEHGLERIALAQADHIASVSRYAAQRTLELCGLAQRPCSVIPNAVDTATFSPSEKIPTEPGLIVFVNSVNPKKGIEQLIAAMNVVCRSHPTVRLVVIGEDTQKPTDGRSYVEQLTAHVAPEYRSRVTFTGRLPRTEIIPWLRRAQICCYPSHMETFGIAVIEAMAVAKPVIFSRTGPGPELIEDGVSGLLCEPYSAADIAAKIQAILENSQLADTLGQNARRRVEQLFDKRDWVKRNLEFYETVCARKPAQH